MKHVEWKHGILTLMQGKFRLMLSLAITTHKSKGCTLESKITDLIKSKKYAGMTLVVLSCVKKPENILLQSYFYERLKKVNNPKQVPIIQSTIQALNSEFEVTKTCFSNFWNHRRCFFTLHYC